MFDKKKLINVLDIFSTHWTSTLKSYEIRTVEIR